MGGGRKFVERGGRPAEPAGFEQPPGEACLAAFGEKAVDPALVGGTRGAAESEGDGPEIEVEETVAAARLEIIIALGSAARDQLDLPLVEAEASISGARLRFGGAVVGKEDALRAALDDRRRDAASGDVGEALGREDHRDILLSEHLQPFATREAMADIEVRS